MPPSKNLTAKQQVQEFLKCKSDPVYFCTNYVQLEAPGGNVLFDLYEPQKKMLKSMVKDHHNIALKSRQIGISTLTQAYITYAMVFYKNVVCGVVSRSGDESTDFCRKVMSMIRYLPAWMKPRFEKEAEQTFILSNGSKLYAGQVNEGRPQSIFRGKSITIAVVDEAAHIPKIDEAYTGFAPALFKNQSVARKRGVPFGTIIISTPNKTVGMGKWYYEQWKSASDPSAHSIFVPHKIHWKDVREFREDPNWYKTQCELLSNVKWKIDQELEMKFIASTNSFFDSTTISVLNETSHKPYIMKIGKYELHQYEKPDRNKFYLIGIDTAPVHGGDSSAIQVLDYGNLNQVCEFKDILRVDDFCKVIDLINRIYPQNLIIVELNSYGNQVAEYLTRTGVFYNLYREKQVNTNSKTKTTKHRYGLYTGPQTRPLIIDSLYSSVSEDPEVIKSERTALELIGLIRTRTDRVQADEGEHDDLAMAYAFCSYVKFFDPPIGMATAAMNQTLTDQIVDITSWNMEENQVYNPEIFDLPMDSSDDYLNRKEKTNKLIHHHIKSNLPNLLRDNGGVIDVTDILGFNTQTNKRNPRYSAIKRNQ